MTEDERLTFETELGISIDKNEDCPTMSICWNCDIPPRKCNYFKDAIDKLAKYEAIGTIEEFKALKNKHIGKDNMVISSSDLMTILNSDEKEIRNKAIDEFAERLKKKYENCVVNDILMNNDVMSYTNSCNVFENFIDEIAEEMRGAING